MRNSRHRRVPSPPATPVLHANKATPPPLGIHELSHNALRNKRRTIESQLKSAPQSKEEHEQLQAQRASIIHELQLRRRTNHKILYITLICLGIGALAFTAFALYNKAHQAHLNLQHALRTGSPSLISLELARVQGGLNPLINSELRRCISEAESTLAEHEQQRLDTLHLLGELEQHPQRWEAVTPQQIRQLGSTLWAQSAEGQDIPRRWHALVKHRRSQQLTLRRESLERVLRPLPPRTPLTGDAAQDLLDLDEEQQALTQRHDEWQTLNQIHHLDGKLIAPVQKRIKHLRLLRRDISMLKRIEQQLRDNPSYSEYGRLLLRYKPRSSYQRSAIEHARRSLPSTQQLAERIHGQPAEPRRPHSKQPSFDAQHAANLQQVALMENIFQSRPLHSRHYQLRNPELMQSWLCESPPKLNKNKLIELTLSPFDPCSAKGDSKKKLLQPNPKLHLCEWRPDELIAKLCLTRSHFFPCANIPLTLEKLLSYRSPHVNARLKLYIYKILTQVIEAHEPGSPLQHALSDELRRDIASLKKLEQQIGFPLDDLSWLRYDRAHLAAEKRAAGWLSRRVGQQYHAAMMQSMNSKEQSGIEFIGFITHEGTPYFYRELPESTPLWYKLGEKEQPQQSTCAELPEKLPAYTPLFCASPAPTANQS